MVRMPCSIKYRPGIHSATLVRGAFLIVCAVNLSSCSQDKTIALAGCQTEADRFYQGYQTDDAANPRSKYIIECMASKGYGFDISSVECDSRRALPTQSTCYASTNWGIRKLETLWNSLVALDGVIANLGSAESPARSPAICNSIHLRPEINKRENRSYLF